MDLSLSGDYDFMLGSLDAFVGGGVAYQDSARLRSKAAARSPANPNFDVDDYVTADLRTGVRFGRYRFSMYATNLFDEYGFQRATTDGVQGNATILRPWTIGAVFTAEF